MDNNVNIPDFKHCVEIQVRYSDLDVLNHVNNAIYLKYFDFGKVKYLSDITGEHFSLKGNMVVLAKIEVDYLDSIVMEDRIELRTRVQRIGSKSLLMEQILVDLNSGKLKAHAESVMVAYHAESSSSQPVPKEWRELISKYEGVLF